MHSGQVSTLYRLVDLYAGGSASNPLPGVPIPSPCAASLRGYVVGCDTRFTVSSPAVSNALSVVELMQGFKLAATRAALIIAFVYLLSRGRVRVFYHALTTGIMPAVARMFQTEVLSRWLGLPTLGTLLRGHFNILSIDLARGVRQQPDALILPQRRGSGKLAPGSIIL